MRNDRVYVDTSVFGGVFDREFEQVSRSFFEEIRQGRYRIVISAIVSKELEPAPQNVWQFYNGILPFAESVEILPAALHLRQAYLNAGIVSAKYADDALHVAVATVWDCAMIVSWNFKHIVHYDKIRLYNGVNAVQGYEEINIFSPLEVIRYEEDI